MWCWLKAKSGAGSKAQQVIKLQENNIEDQVFVMLEEEPTYNEVNTNTGQAIRRLNRDRTI